MVISKFMNKSFYERLFSGIILVIIALITIILGNDILLVTVGIVSLIGLYEMNRVFGIEKYATGILSYIAVIIYYAMLRFDMMTYVPFLIVALLIACMAIYVFEFPKCKTEQVMAAIFGTIYVAVMLSFVYLVRMGNNGAYNVWLIFLCSWGSDTCAYVFGVAFGKHKMAPVLSPKKSIEGCIAGTIGAVILMLGYTYFADTYWGVSYSYGYIAIIGVILSLIGQIGDFSASSIKRYVDIKDFSNLIPGHGGMLDRIDSLLFLAPFAYALFTLL